MTRERKIATLGLLVIAGFLAALGFHYFMGAYLGLGYPYDTFLFNPGDRFMDFVNLKRAVVNGNPYAYSYSAYFPAAYLILKILEPLNRVFPWFSILIFFTAWVSWTAVYLRHSLRLGDSLRDWRNVLVFSVMTYPFLFAFDRGNLEPLVFCCIGASLVYDARNRTWPSALCLAVAIAMKGHPALFLLYFASTRKYRQIALTCAMAGALSLFSAAIFRGGIPATLTAMSANIALVMDRFAVHDAGLIKSSSLLGLLKILWMGNLDGWIPVNEANRWALYHAYPFIALVLLAPVSLLAYSRRTLPWQKVTLLSTAMVLLPQVSHDYRLIHLLIPTMYFINNGHPTRKDAFYCTLFGLLLIPKGYFYLFNDVGISSVFNPLLLLILLIVVSGDALTSKPTPSIAN